MNKGTPTLFLQVKLAERVQTDFTDILRWTAEHFGTRQAQSYR